MVKWHCTLGVLLVSMWPGVVSAQDGQPGATFRVFLSGRAIGTEQVAVTQREDGWSVAGSGRLEAPVNLDTSWFEVIYDADWHPYTLDMDANLRGETLAMKIGFGADVSTATITRGIEESVVAHRISRGTLVLSDSFFAAYEALARQLADLEVGDEVSAYFTGQGEIQIRLDRVLEERIRTPERSITARRHLLTFLRPNGPFGAEVWSDECKRLLRLSLPNAAVEVLREDIATVNARRETLFREGDESVRIKALGFVLAGTLSKPIGDAPRRGYPAVVLVPSSTAQDRDEATDGVPVAGLLAAALADAGYYVVRYDRRGVAQSGGRPEAAGVGEYAGDVRAAVEYLDDRKDVDDDRIIVIGRGDSGLIALQAVAREKKIDRLVLVGTASVLGTELVLEQQRRVLDASSLTEAEKAERVELQERIHAAVKGDGDWEGVSEEVRRQADTAWFRSFLAFDPAEAIRRMRQAILIIQPELDRQISPDHAERLAALAGSRKKHDGVEVTHIAGVDDRLIAGREDSTPDVRADTLAPEVVDAIVEWLGRRPER